jgi:hypothetical protein
LVARASRQLAGRLAKAIRSAAAGGYPSIPEGEKRKPRKKAPGAPDHRGIPCEVCGFAFELVYGTLGIDFIECHLLVPLSEMVSALI